MLARAPVVKTQLTHPLLISRIPLKNGKLLFILCGPPSLPNPLLKARPHSLEDECAESTNNNVLTFLIDKVRTR